jgi:hypothetical protein
MKDREIVCSHCGAVFFSGAEVPVCPHCGRNPQGTPWRRMGALGTENLGVILWILWFVLVFQPWQADWGTVAVTAALAVAAGATIVYFRKSSKGSKGPVTALNLTARPNSFAGPWTEPKPPSVPGRWSSLMSLPRPREVFWPWRSKLSKIVDVAFMLGTAGYIGIVIHGDRITFAGWQAVTPKDLRLFAMTAMADLAVIAGIYREIENLHFLRDGEVTIGRIVDWIENRRSLRTALYQFWTRSGERFQHRGAIRSDKDEYSDMGPVPVFYFPEDPSRSLALCCTSLRVRIPSEELEANMQRAAAK